MKYQHCFHHSVRFDEVDMLGLVYHPNFFVFADRARSQYLKEEGFGFAQMIQNHHGLAVAKITGQFLAPMMVEEDITIASRVSQLNERSVVVEQHFFKGTFLKNDDFSSLKPCFSAEVVLVSLDLKTKMPKALGEKLTEVLSR